MIKVIPPFRGEFGHLCMWFAPWVNAIEGDKIVFCESGTEAMFPGALECVPVNRRHDDDRREWTKPDAGFASEVIDAHADRIRSKHGQFEVVELPKGSAEGFDQPRDYFVPQPIERVGIDCDVVVCPRRRGYGADKNWPHWQSLIDLLTDDGLKVLAAGAPDSSDDSVQCLRAWDYSRYLDMSIEAMLSADVVVSTDNGLAHLAVLCGKPLVMISHGAGLVAPGERPDGKGAGRPWWPIKLDRYERINHTASPITVVKHSWDHPDKVAFHAMAHTLGKGVA